MKRGWNQTTFGGEHPRINKFAFADMNMDEKNPWLVLKGIDFTTGHVFLPLFFSHCFLGGENAHGRLAKADCIGSYRVWVRIQPPWNRRCLSLGAILGTYF